MNDVLTLLHAHRSIRHYADEPVPDADVAAAIRAGQRASTSSAIEAYCCLRVRDPGTRQELVALTGGQEKVAAAPLFLVICGDTRRHRLTGPYDARLEAFLLAAVDASLFAQNMVIAFESMGYGICYIGGLRNQLPEVDRLLEIPEGVYPLFGLCVGKPAETPLPRPRLPLDAVLCEERYPADGRMRELMAEHDGQVAGYYRQRGIDPAPTWTGQMAKKFAAPRRPDLAAYYQSKGADLG